MSIISKFIICIYSYYTFSSIIRLDPIPHPSTGITSEQGKEREQHKMKIYAGLSVTLFFINPKVDAS